MYFTFVTLIYFRFSRENKFVNLIYFDILRLNLMKLKYYVQLYKCNHLLNDRLNENLFFIGLDKIALT